MLRIDRSVLRLACRGDQTISVMSQLGGLDRLVDRICHAILPPSKRKGIGHCKIVLPFSAANGGFVPDRSDLQYVTLSVQIDSFPREGVQNLRKTTLFLNLVAAPALETLGGTR